MNSHDALKWNQLILLAIDGTISPDDFARLDNGIRTNPELARHYVQFMVLYTGLRQPGQVSTFFTESGAKSDSGLDMELWNEMATFEKTAETVEVVLPSRTESPLPSDTEPIRMEHKVSRVAVYTSIVSIAALVLMGIFVYMNPRTTESVGILTKTVDAEWLNNTEILESGQDLRKGVLHLERGLAQIRFDSGAKVILEGPVQVELLGDNSMSVMAGKVVATVGREAVGFVVSTPQGKILDLGTEFGIQVSQAGQSQVHVFHGEVVLYPKDNKEHYNLLQGSAKAMDQAGGIEDIPLRTMAFIRQDEMDSRLLAQSGDSYSRWKASMFELHRDPSLVAHYVDFKDNARADLLFNTASSADKLLSGQSGIDGRTSPVWVQGRWPQKNAVKFERGKNQAIVIPVNPDLPLNGPVTVSTWVYFADEKKKGGHLISCRDADWVNFQYSVFDDNYRYDYQENRFEFLRFKLTQDGGSYSKIFKPQSGVWYHLAVTHDMQTVSFYVDGQLFQAKPYANKSHGSATNIIIGAMKQNGRYVLPEGDFDGVVDEILIFNRSLGGEEIAKIYTNGVPVFN